MPKIRGKRDRQRDTDDVEAIPEGNEMRATYIDDRRDIKCVHGDWQGAIIRLGTHRLNAHSMTISNQ